jgi:LacI family transcriptional regulator
MTNRPKTYKRAVSRKRVTVVEVARLAGVSAMTVSNFINAPERVSDRTGRKVKEAIEMLGYMPSQAARALSSGRSHAIGLPIYPDSNVPVEEPSLGGFLYGFMEGLVRSCAMNGYGVYVTCPTKESSEIQLYERLIAAKQVDAIVVTETVPNDPRVEFLDDRAFPFVVFGRTDENRRQSWVDVDNRKSMTAMTRHVLDSGRRKLAYVGSDNSLPWERQRLSGFVEQLTQQALKPHSITKHRDLGSVSRYLKECLGSGDLPDAFIFDNDAYAILAMQQLGERGLKVGQDIAVTGFNDVGYASMLDVPLTTVRIPLPAIAKAVFERAMREMDHRDDEPGTLVPAPVIVRDSA